MLSEEEARSKLQQLSTACLANPDAGYDLTQETDLSEFPTAVLVEFVFDTGLLRLREEGYHPLDLWHGKGGALNRPDLTLLQHLSIILHEKFGTDDDWGIEKLCHRQANDGERLRLLTELLPHIKKVGCAQVADACLSNIEFDNTDVDRVREVFWVSEVVRDNTDGNDLALCVKIIRLLLGEAVD